MRRLNWRQQECVVKRWSYRGKVFMAWNKPSIDSLKVVGKPFRKVDARAKCVGQTKFADDIVLPRMLFCKMLRSHLPHALIKSVDVSKAVALPGVIAIIRSEEHTSELQSHHDLVCRLLL